MHFLTQDFEANIPDTDIVNLSTVLDYQERSVVSRVLLKNAGGGITLFAFDKGESLSEHKTPFDAFVTVIEGTTLIGIDGRKHNLSEGDSIVLPANIPHSVDAVTKFKMLLVMLKAPNAAG